MQCPILRSGLFRDGAKDMGSVRELFVAGKDHILDEEGIDWWDLTSLVIAPEAESVLVFQRLAVEIGPVHELWTTRPGWPANVMAILLKAELQTFSDRLPISAKQGLHYARLFRRFPLSKITEIGLDKYDSQYRWRARFASRPRSREQAVILVPSAYSNVSRMAASYARLLPSQSFLLVATRRNAKQFTLPTNMQMQGLAGYVDAYSKPRETASILEKWRALRPKLRLAPEIDLLDQVGVLDRFESWFRDCLVARDAWREVLAREPVQSVLCGDDSNLYTRLPVLLAAKRKIPTLDFHHGALDGRYMLKNLPSDLYLAKNEMERDYLVRVCGLPAERVVIGAPGRSEK